MYLDLLHDARRAVVNAKTDGDRRPLDVPLTVEGGVHVHRALAQQEVLLQAEVRRLRLLDIRRGVLHEPYGHPDLAPSVRLLLDALRCFFKGLVSFYEWCQESTSFPQHVTFKHVIMRQC